jgi:hypothetical protein
VGPQRERPVRWHASAGRGAVHRKKSLSQIDQKAIDAAAIARYPGDNNSPATRNREVDTPISAVLKHAGFDFKFIDQRARVAASR